MERSLIAQEYNACLHQALVSSTVWVDSVGLASRITCRFCGKTIEIPHLTSLTEGAYGNIIKLAFGFQLTG